MATVAPTERTLQGRTCFILHATLRAHQILAEGFVIWGVGYVNILLSSEEEPALLLRSDEVSGHWIGLEVFVYWCLGSGERERYGGREGGIERVEEEGHLPVNDATVSGVFKDAISTGGRIGDEGQLRALE